MEIARDLGHPDLWQESLERSLARRGRTPRTSVEWARLSPDRDISDEEFMLDYAGYWRMRREASSRRPLMPVIGVGGAVAALAVTLPKLLGGGATAKPEPAAYIDHSSRPVTRAHVKTRFTAVQTNAVQTSQRDRYFHAAPKLTHVARPVRHTVAPVQTAPQPAPTPTHTVKTAPKLVQHVDLHRSKPAKAVTHQPVHTAVIASAHTPAAKPSHASAPQPPAQTTPTSTTPTTPTTPKPAAKTPPPASHSGSTSHTGSTGGAGQKSSGQSTPTSSVGYVNPLAHASVTPERIDQGVDYGGSGPLGAIGAGKITYVGTTGTGWPGAFIEFRLANGQDAGRYVYYAEGIIPAQGLHVGQRVSAGQVIATMTGSSGGIEIGWGAGIGTESYAMKVGQWKSGMDGDNTPTAAGKNFSALVASLGGPAGKIEG